MRRLIIERSAIRSNMAVIKERAQGAALYGVVLYSKHKRRNDFRSS